VAILVLGGYGNTGWLIAGLLLKHTAESILLAGRRIEKAEQAVKELGGGTRIRAVYADAADAASLRAAMQGASMIVIASSTSEHTETVARAAMEAGLDSLDIEVSLSKLETLKRMRDEIEASGRCFVTDAGFHPGIPAALIRYAATRIEHLTKATVKSVIKLDWAHYEFSDSTRREIAEEFRNYKTLHFRNGQWEKAGFFEYGETDFGDPFGKQYEVPMFLEELRPLPKQIPSLRDMGFYVGGFNWFSDTIVLPLGYAAVSLFHDRALPAVGKALEWSLKAFSKPPYGTALLLEASGAGADLRLKVSHADGYFLTAASVVACIIQLLAGTIRKPGLHCEGNLVDPRLLLEQLQTMGISVD